MNMTFDIQRLRNLTTGRLHTNINCFYEDLERITGQQGLMTHMLPRVLRAVTPWLQEKVTEPRFWEDKYDENHEGEITLPEPTQADREQMFEIYKTLPSPFAA